MTTLITSHHNTPTFPLASSELHTTTNTTITSSFFQPTSFPRIGVFFDVRRPHRANSTAEGVARGNSPSVSWLVTPPYCSSVRCTVAFCNALTTVWRRKDSVWQTPVEVHFDSSRRRRRKEETRKKMKEETVPRHLSSTSGCRTAKYTAQFAFPLRRC